jgi:CheY-like chemotaxis protein
MSDADPGRRRLSVSRSLQLLAVAMLVLTDLAMTGMGGLELARSARALLPLLPIVFISGYADPGGTDGHMRLRRLVRKPFRPGELRVEIEAALAVARASAA